MEISIAEIAGGCLGLGRFREHDRTSDYRWGGGMDLENALEV